jgi:hypothetical protein
MHSIRLDIQDNVFDKVIYFLSNLPKNEVKIVEDKISKDSSFDEDIQSFSNHSANLIEEWKDTHEDDIWT